MFTNSIPIFQAAEQSTLNGKPAAIGAFNVNFYTQAQGILEGLRRAEAPGIIQASRGANSFQGGPLHIAQMLRDAMGISNHKLPVVLHLDHGTREAALECIETGFSSVMIDASHFAFDENISETKLVVEAAHPKQIQVEGEYGTLAGVEEDISHAETSYADPQKVVEFFKRSGCDSLAIAYGTSHGPNKGQNTSKVNTEIVRLSHEALVKNKMNMDHFLVSHGSSTVPHEMVAEINKYGGKIEKAHGIPMDRIQEAIKFGVRKVNIDTDLRLGITATFRKYFHDHPRIEQSSELLAKIKKVLDEKLDAIDPRQYLGVIDINLLRQDARGTELEEVMGLVQETVAKHVEMLCYKFGAAGLK
ncbi:MAG: class II fructose-bisphosphate aldolase [Candidatus Gracilibacteria bacterium]|nr:class II fructose-bisphosphate aldolase [Candidatus Gracilibacteria bacterium]